MATRRRLLLPASFLGVVIALPAFAQQPAVTYPTPCEASKVSKADIDRAHTVFLSGKQYLEESNYDKAISYFIDAYAIDCSVHAILPIIAAAYERKGDKGEAIRALEEYLRRAPQAPDHEVVERRIRNLKDQLAREPPPVAPAAPPASAGAAPPVSNTEPAPSASIAAPPTAPAAPAAPAAEKQQSAAPWVLVGGGGVAMAAGVASLITGYALVASASSTCPTRSSCSADVVSKGNTGLTLIPVGYGVAGGGAVLLGAGLLWHFLEGKGTGPATQASAAPVVGPGFAGVAVTGSL
jgi:tetratricopeptide (TPR) repeat protein